MPRGMRCSTSASALAKRLGRGVGGRLALDIDDDRREAAELVPERHVQGETPRGVLEPRPRVAASPSAATESRCP